MGMDRDLLVKNKQHLPSTPQQQQQNQQNEKGFSRVEDNWNNNNHHHQHHQQQQPTNRSVTSLSENQFLNSVPSTTTTTSSNNNNNNINNTGTSSLVPDRSQPIKVWRDPHLITEAQIRHIDSPQHHSTFIMSHGGSGGPPSSLPYHHNPSALLSSIPNPISNHQQQQHQQQQQQRAPGHFVPSQRLNESHWRPRYTTASVVSSPNFVPRPSEEQHNSRGFRTEQDMRDKRTDIKKSTDQAVQQHFDESLARLAQHKGNWPPSRPISSIKFEDEQQSRHMLLTTVPNAQLDKRYFGSQPTAYNMTQNNHLIKTELPVSSHLQNESITKLSVDPKLMYSNHQHNHNNNNNNNSNKIDMGGGGNQRSSSREQHPPPSSSTDRYFVSGGGGHQQNAPGFYGGGSGGNTTSSLPLQRAKVSSPGITPQKIYGRPGISIPVSRGLHSNNSNSNNNNNNSNNDGVPLSLTSKTTTRIFEAPPLSSTSSGNNNNNNNSSSSSLPKHEVRSDEKVVAYYMYQNSNNNNSNSGLINSYRQHGIPPPLAQSIQNMDIQTQPLDLGGKRKPDQEAFLSSQNLDPPKKSKNEDSPLDLKPKDRVINFSNYNSTTNSDIKPPMFNSMNLSTSALSSTELNNSNHHPYGSLTTTTTNNNSTIPILRSITSHHQQQQQLPSNLSSNSIPSPYTSSGLLTVPNPVVTVSPFSAQHVPHHHKLMSTNPPPLTNSLINSNFRNISMSQQSCTSSPPPLQLTANNNNKSSSPHQALLIPTTTTTPAITIKPLVSKDLIKEEQPLPLRISSPIISATPTVTICNNNDTTTTSTTSTPISNSTSVTNITNNININNDSNINTITTTISTPNTTVNTNTSTTAAAATITSTANSAASSNPPVSSIVVNKGTTSHVHKLKKAWLQRHSGEDGSAGDYSPVKNNIAVNNNNNNNNNNNSSSKSPTNGDRFSPSLNNNNIGCDKSGDSGASVGNSNGPLNNSNNHTRNSRGGGKKGTKSRRKKVQELNRSSPVGSLNGHNGGGKKRTSSSSASDEQEDTNKRTTARQPHKKQRHILKETKSSPVESTESENGGSDSNDGGSSKGSQPATPQQGNFSGRKRGRKPTTTTNTTTSSSSSSTTTIKTVNRNKSKNPFKRPPIHLLKKNGESFLQDGPCSEVAQKLGKCRECRFSGKGSKKQSNIFCRFYAFRKLRYTKNGVLAIAGFSDPNTDPSEEDLSLWVPSQENVPDIQLDVSKLLVSQLGDQFCDLIQQEKEALDIHVTDGETKTIAWKRVVQGVREMCDVCDTTLFNYHWACGKCGFVVCIGCYKGRKTNSAKILTEPGKDRDDYQWLFCSNRAAHELDKLMLTQAIAGDALHDLGKSLHEIRHKWNIPQLCACPDAKSVSNSTEKSKKFDSNGVLKTQDGSSSDDSDVEDHSTLRDLLIQAGSERKEGDNDENITENDSKISTDSKVTTPDLNNSTNNDDNNGNTSTPPPAATSTTTTTSTEISNNNNINNNNNNNESKNVDSSSSLVHFVRPSSLKNYSRHLHPIKSMTLSDSKELFPSIPHSWLCSGKLLKLEDPINEGNYSMFADMWKRGQPVIVGNVNNRLNKNLWTPESFSRDYGHKSNDLINYMTGKIVANQPMKRFWDGFDYMNKRLKDDKGNPMLLKLKDWPPGEDFADVLPDRFKDLMTALPLTDYTNRNGRMNLAARLPDNFVKPDLGPKMYIAYGSGLHLDKGTTNLHLDMSDAVNVMVYVGTPKDCDSSEHLKAVTDAVEESDCDVLTVKKVLENPESIGALWHIYNSRDADKIRDLLNKVAKERGIRLEPNHDPIHDQSWYLDTQLRKRLMDEYNVSGYPIIQCLGDAVFIPAGAPHQVRNLSNCIKIAEDFVSPENVSHCFDLTEEFRRLSDTHSNHEDKLQIKNIIYFTVKDALSVLMNNEDNVEKNTASSEEKDVKVNSISSV